MNLYMKTTTDSSDKIENDYSSKDFNGVERNGLFWIYIIWVSSY